MTKPLNAAFSGLAYFTKAGILTDPAGGATVLVAFLPDGAVMATSLTHVSTGVYRVDVAANVANVAGIPVVAVTNTDATMDYPTYEPTMVEVGTNDVTSVWAGVTQSFFAKFFTQNSGEVYHDAVDGSVVKEIAANATTDPTSVAHAVWAYVIGGSAASDLLALLPIMWARLVGLGNNVAFSSMVSPDGKEIRFIQGDDYLLANNRPLILPLPPGFSPLTPGQAVTLGLAKVGGQTQRVTGTAVDAQTMRWDIPASVNRLMPLGRSEFSVLELTASTYRNTPYTGWAVVRKVRTSS